MVQWHTKMAAKRSPTKIILIIPAKGKEDDADSFAFHVNSKKPN